MKSAIRISLRSGERIYINGAVVRVDRKVSIELLNDVTFLLESQVMQVQDATTPLRQLYFVVQLMLMSPSDARRAAELCGRHLQALRQAITNVDILTGLRTTEDLICGGRHFEALKTIRGLFAAERLVLGQGDVESPIQAA
jgi:flagellar protein FlbT